MEYLALIQSPIRNLLENFGIQSDVIVFGNSILQYAEALILFLVFIAIFKVFQLIIIGRLKTLAEKTETDVDDTVIAAVKSVRPPFYSFIAFYFAVQFLEIGGLFEKTLDVVLIIWIFYQVIAAVQIFINFFIERKTKEDSDPSTKSAFELLGKLAKGALWGIGILMVLSNLNVDVSSLLAGLGIGGIAIAFALQNILGDLFSSFALYFDKPFKVGDFIVVGDKMGTVLRIGIKTTRLRALAGEEIIISNKELTSARIQNYKKMEERRIVFGLGVVYQTPAEKVKQIPNMIEGIIKGVDGARFDRAHFKVFGDSALNFEVVYYVTNADYAEYMNIQQEINVRLFELFEKENIEFAYPTQTLFIEK